MAAPVRLRSLVVFAAVLMSMAMRASEEALPLEGRSVIVGRVTDDQSGAPLDNANVYLSATSIGTTTGADGRYRLGNIPPGVFHLVGSRVGHALTSVRVTLTAAETLHIDIQLKPVTLQHEEVEVVAPEDREWKRLLALFTRAFIGRSPSAGQCRILNPEVINFHMMPGSSTLVASTDSVVRIDNEALGYALYVRVGMYEWDVTDDYGRYLLYPRFEPLVPHGAEEARIWKENRRKTYEGSLKHFLCSLVAGTLRQEQFIVHYGKLSNLEAGSSSPLRSDEYTLQRVSGQPLWRLAFKDWMRVDFRKGTERSRSYIALNRETVLIDDYGNLVDPLSVDVTGDWTHSRVADLLPLYEQE